jgi:hypothetical protein
MPNPYTFSGIEKEREKRGGAACGGGWGGDVEGRGE